MACHSKSLFSGVFMSSTAVLPAFLAGFVCAAGVGVLLAQTLYAPFQTELSSTRERLLSQERLHQQELGSCRETAERAARLACTEKVAGAVADAERRCKAEAPVCTECAPATAATLPGTCTWPNDSEALLALLAAAAANSSAVVPPSPPPLDAPAAADTSPELNCSAADWPPVVAVNGADCGACIASSVVVGEAASVKWVLEPARDASMRPGAVDDVHVSYSAVRDGGLGGGDGSGGGDEVEKAVFRLAHGDAHSPAEGWAAALRSMAVGEHAAFRFASPTPSAAATASQPWLSVGGMAADAAGAGGTTYEVRLLGVTPVEDLSPPRHPAHTRAPTLLKRILTKGSGAETPADGAKIQIDLTVAARPATDAAVADADTDTASGNNTAANSANGTAADGNVTSGAPAVTPSTADDNSDAGASHAGLDLILGDGVGGEGLRLALLSMTRGEVAVVSMHPSLAAAPIMPPTAGNATAAGGYVEVTVRLLAFEQPRAVELMSAAELLAHVTRLKTRANSRFAAGATESACTEYERAQRVLRLFDEPSASAAEVESWGALRLALSLNGAACLLKAGRNEAALAQSDAALALSPSSAKAHFRRGQALSALGKLADAEAAFKAVLAIEPASREANAKLAEVQARMGSA